jgi:diaminohydroxyphosphoribosylaminopyrimidine deaminase/5-amino-6-(5-phosphoribosylamino)uracil reductase
VGEAAAAAAADRKPSAMDPERAMRRALSRARRREGRTHPNPTVGAAVVKGDRVLATGATSATGGPHAEIVALAAARRRHGARALRGAGLAVTLEPCHHQGRTGPCSQAIRDAGLARVWVGHRDPNPAVSDRGIRALRRAGVEVAVGILEEECRWLHRGFISVQQRERPWVALKLAATLDGRIATRGGESRWITGALARAHVHQLRGRVDAVMVGSATARSDDPELTVRSDGKRVHCPVRILVDSKLVVPTRRRLFRDRDAARTWVLAGRAAPAGRRAAREACGARVLPIATRGGHLDLRVALRTLAWEGLTSVLVEGGGSLAAALLRAGLVDEVHWYTAPSLLGADARPAVAGLQVARLGSRPELEVRDLRRLGPDLYVHGTLPLPRRGRP